MQYDDLKVRRPMHDLSIEMIDSACNWDDNTPDVVYSGSPVSSWVLSIASL